jgi:hypothetical protein
LNDYGVGADYRTSFVHRDDDTPRVNRLTAGFTFGSTDPRDSCLVGRRGLVACSSALACSIRATATLRSEQFGRERGWRGHDRA